MLKLEAMLSGVPLLTAIYALLTVGLVLVFRATRVLNFSAGALGLVGAYMTYELQRGLNDFYPALVLGLICAFAFGGLAYRLILAPISGSRANVGASTDVGVLLGTIVLASAIGAAVPFLAGSQPINYSIPLPGWKWRAGAFNLNSLDVIAFAVMVVVVVLIGQGTMRLPLGLRMRAAADRPRLAGYFSVNTTNIAMVSWAIAAVVGTLAVLAYAASAELDPSSGNNLGAALFPALLLGGLDSIIGCLIGAVLLALVQSAAVVYLGGNWLSVAPYFFLLAVLIIRPHGFFGRGEFSRL
jgi:branched-chain amino acid transport system permease protein